jgi:hypothetical protein
VKNRLNAQVRHTHAGKEVALYNSEISWKQDIMFSVMFTASSLAPFRFPSNMVRPTSVIRKSAKRGRKKFFFF